MDEETKTKLKFKCVLYELLKDDYKVTDDTVFEKLLSHLSEKDEGSQIIDAHLCSAWVHSAIASWRRGKLSSAIMSFAFRLLSIIIEDEHHFLNIENSTISLENSESFLSSSHGCSMSQLLNDICISTFQSTSNFSMKCSLVQLLSALLKHSSGRQWIMKQGLWKAIHVMCLNDPSVYVAREARKFLSNLLNGEPEVQESEAQTVFDWVLQPILSVSSFSEPLPDHTKLIASLYLVNEIIENIYLTSHPTIHKLQSPVVGIVINPSLGLLPKFLEALKTSRSEEIEEIASKICILIYILTIIKDGVLPGTSERKGTCIQILDVFNELINKGSVENVLKLCVTCHNHWTHVAKLRPTNAGAEKSLSEGNEKEKDDDKYRFEDQLLCLQLAPMFCLIMATPTENEKELYLYNLSRKICFESQRLAFSFRSIVQQRQRLPYWLAMSVKSVMCWTGALPLLLPVCVGLSEGPNIDIFKEWSEAYFVKLTSLLHNRVLRLGYLYRSAITEQGLNERLALLSVSCTVSQKHFLTRLTPLYVGCTIGDSTLESHFQIEISKRLEINVMRSVYTLRDSLVKNRHLMDRSALRSVTSVCSLRGRGSSEIQQERAVLVFQSFIYVLKHYVQFAESETKHGGWGGEFRQSHHSTLLVAILDGLANLVRSHRISWRESVESLCLLTLAQELLNSPTFSIKVGLVVQALQLIQLCIENFMPPNLALLTNSMSGSSLDKLGPLIYKRLHDPQWEVRDSSLEVLLTLATISHTKYPLFQDLILDNKLCEVVVHLSVNDAESYVCASATKCLTAMVRVDRLWNAELSDKDLVNKMIGILNGESEGVLRREASLLMSQIFKHRKVMPDVFLKMCVTMANVVLSDLHWEVKVNALSFWELVIEHHMNNQGMIDGEFPQVTFSKEHRKIINLTPSVIQERLRKVMSELSQNGCLHVLLEVIHKDEDLEVVKKASHIISSLSEVLERYDILDPKKLSTSSVTVPDTSSALNSKNVAGLSTEWGCDHKTGDNSMCSPESYVQSHLQFDSLNSGLDSTLTSGELPSVSFSDLDQALGFAALSSDGDLTTSQMKEAQDKVIDSILNDRDINLLAKVYMGTGAEAPGRQGPETKVFKPVKPLVIMSPYDFLQQLSAIEIKKIVDERSRWIEDTGSNIDTLLDDMLISRNINFENEDDCNAMDCY